MDERASVKISLIQFIKSQVNLVSLHQKSLHSKRDAK